MTIAEYWRSYRRWTSRFTPKISYLRPHRSGWSVSAFIFSLFVSINAAAVDPIPVETLAKLPALSGLSISRDGDYMVGLIAPPDDPGAERQLLAVWDPRDLSKPPLLTKPDGDVEFIFAQALKAGKILVVARTKWTGALGGCGEGKRIGSTKTYLTKVFVTDTKFSKFSEPFAAKKKGSARLTGGGYGDQLQELCFQVNGSGGIRADLPLDPDNVIISQQSNLYSGNVKYLKYNLKTGDKEYLFKNAGGKGIGVIDLKSGEVLSKTDRGYNGGDYYFQNFLPDESGDFEIHEKLTWNSKTRHSINIVGYIPETNKFYVSTDQFSDKSRIYIYDGDKRAYDDTPLFQHEKFNVTGVIQSRAASDFGKVLGYNVAGAASKTIWKDPTLGGVSKAFEGKYPGKNINITSWTNDRSSIVVRVDGGDLAPVYYLVTNGSKTTLLGSERPELVKMKLSPTKLVYYKARDGKEIPALLTLPVGWKQGDPAPRAIVHPHGGPWARDAAGWDQSGWVPFLSSRGYAVLQPQYRGSQGWGRELWISGDAEWGQKMQDDKDDGAAWMVFNGYAAKDKIAIFGYSYGGFAAFAAAVRPDSPYVCAIGGAGVSDLARIGFTWSDDPVQRALQGKTVKGMDPMKNTDKTNIPVLVFHGDRDVRVPMFHGKDFYNKVKKHVDAEMVVIKDQPHSLPWTPAMQRKSLTAIEDFLENSCF